MQRIIFVGFVSDIGREGPHAVLQRGGGKALGILAGGQGRRSVGRGGPRDLRRVGRFRLSGE